jgi:hypothetical protein
MIGNRPKIKPDRSRHVTPPGLLSGTRPPRLLQDPTNLEVDHTVAAFVITTRQAGSHSAAAAQSDQL